MKKKYLLLILNLSAISVFAQQLPQFTQITNVLQYINPASTGAANELSIGILGRHQWIGLVDGNGESIYPRTYLFMLETPMQSINSGIGLTAYMDKIGFDMNLNIRINYAYHIKLGSVGNKLSLGASLEMINQTVDLKDYGYIAANETLKKHSASALDAGIGVYFSNRTGSFAGISAHNILQSKVEFENFNYIGSTQYQFITGTKLKVSESRNLRIDFLPSLLIKTCGTVPPQYDVNALILLNERFYGGIIYRYEDAVGIKMGVVLESLKFGLSYDYTISSLRNAGSIGSPEIMIAYRKLYPTRIDWRSLYNTRDL